MPKRGRRVRLRFKCGAMVPLAALLIWSGAAAQTSDATALTGEVELARLVDLCAERLGVPIEYDPRVLQDARVTLRLSAPVVDDRLWELTNQLLVTRGFTSIQTPGTGPPVLSVVRLADAAAQARLERATTPATLAGYATIRTSLRHRPGSDLSKAIKPLLSKPGGVVTVVDEGNVLLISDLKPRLQQAVETIEVLDVPGSRVAVEIIPVLHQSGSELAALVAAAVTSRNALAAPALDGRLTPTPDASGLILVAPDPALDEWRRLIASFDQPAGVETRTILPSTFPLDKVAGLIEQTARDPGPRGSGDRWQVVADELTGSLIVTATPWEFDRIEELLQRLDSVPPGARRTIRTIKIRNRAIGEVVELLSGMIDAGVLEAGAFHRRGGAERPDFQRSPRDGISPPSSPPAQPPARPTPTDAGPDDNTLTLTADEGTNTLIAIGEPREVDQVEELVRQIDVRQPQVMIEAMVIALNDADTLDLGIELEKLEMFGSTLVSLSSLFGLGGAGAVGGAMLPDAAGQGFTGIVLNPGDFSALVRALETINEGRSLNTPKVLVNNNQQALLDSVLQQPFTNVNASTTVSTTSFG
ncbi:MAG: hypothetical protein GY722_28995, partial [bacterium]|nr:hypothetical protein [bacterium]